MTERAVKAAVVGVGYWGPNLIRNFHALDACEGVVAYDIDESRLKGILRVHPTTEVVSSLAEILDDPGVGVVAVATPVATHAELALRALRAGKHVLVEKPLAATSRDASAVVQLARDRNLLSMAGHTFLYSPPVQAI